VEASIENLKDFCYEAQRWEALEYICSNISFFSWSKYVYEVTAKKKIILLKKTARVHNSSKQISVINNKDRQNWPFSSFF
jgi:hypothetical protein